MNRLVVVPAGDKHEVRFKQELDHVTSRLLMPYKESLSRSLSLSLSTCIYIYTCREREREILYINMYYS